ncbi:MMPL/RND family transporter [Mycolicibacterium celeriflavum]|uniref:Putative membrane protein, MmpL family n=1 Tax=Mycolicibacterium celeriflavum TaxID=1249101 RepID=A0A7I7RIF2_MYCCF|nr:RND family transporter [Mycolicibacterium celeriflavum]MCV7237874.1 RND family transporter [Mycolicibacterium celeriflavum]BBY43715.1 putative membrane protein, MmpL family [Mycolicibacterium celeriflavum]
MAERLAHLTSRYAVWVVVVWVVAAGAANLAVPQLERVVESHSRSFMPAQAPSSVAAMQGATLLGEKPSNNLNYVVLEGDQPLGDDDKEFYHRLVTNLRADDEHVYAVTDLWSDPATAAGAQSEDGHAVTVMTRLSGMLGTSRAADAVDALRDIVMRLDPPDGLGVYVTGPGATIADEFRAIDRQMLGITAATVALILLLLLIVYRSPVGAAIPLISVGLALAVARPIVAALGDAGLAEVSLFSVALLAAMMLGAGTDYAIFLIGRYHEGRRRGDPSAASLLHACRGVAPVIVGSALTIAAALTSLSFAEIGMFRSTGIPCAVGVLVAMLASMSLTPALIALAGRRGRLEPRPSTGARRWRRIGVHVARWPAPILTASAVLIVVSAIPVAGLRIGWNEPAATPADTESNQGYAAADRHFGANHLLATVVNVAAPHDIRNPAGLIAVERITRQIMEIPGVRMVQSASRPAGTVPDEATLSWQAGIIGEQFAATIDGFTERLGGIAALDNALGSMTTAVDQLSQGLQGSAAGLSQMGSAAADMRAGMAGLETNVTAVSGYLDPLRGFVSSTPNCPANPICSVVARVVQPADDVIRSSAQLSSGATKLTDGSTDATEALAALPPAVDTMSAQLRQARAATADLASLTTSLGPQLHQVTDYLQEIATAFRDSAAGGFYMPQRALADPSLRAALDRLMSDDGRATYLLVYGDGHEWGGEGAHRASQIETAVREATKEGTLKPTAVHITGVGPATADLQRLVAGDTTMLMAVTLALIFGIVALLLRSPVAGIVVVGTVAVSYAAALGASVVIWQHLLHHDLHWAVAPISFIALVAVGADYNLLLAMRIREETHAGLGTGIVRAFGATGGVVTAAGIVFGITMFALAGSSVLSIAQIGVTIGVGLLLDTLIVRTFVLPSLVALLGRWFWWPTVRLVNPRPSPISAGGS